MMITMVQVAFRFKFFGYRFAKCHGVTGSTTSGFGSIDNGSIN